LNQQKAEAKKVEVKTEAPDIEIDERGYISDPELLINDEWDRTEEGRHFLTICKEEGLAF